MPKIKEDSKAGESGKGDTASRPTSPSGTEEGSVEKSLDELPQPYIGKTSATERSPNTVDEFKFWLKRGQLLNPFDFVAVEHAEGSITIGVVREMQLMTDAQSHLSNYVSNNFGDVDETPNTLRVGAVVVTAGVMVNTGYRLKDRPDEVEVGLPVSSDKPVRFATSTEIERALGIRSMRNPIPGGMIEMSDGTSVPVMVNGDYLLGPEGAHINASGTSGLATKTSYLMFLLQAVYQAMGDKVAIVVFNVKQHDLLHLHEAPDDLTERDRRLYNALGFRAEPFAADRVKYFLPKGEGGPNSEYVPDNSELYAYEFSDAKERLDLLFSEIDDPQGTIESIVEHIRDSQELRQIRDVQQGGQVRLAANEKVENWDQLRAFDSYPQEVVTHKYSLYRFKRHLTRMTKANPLFPNSKGECVNLGDSIGRIKAGDVHVVDIARIGKTEEQAFIVGDVMSRIDEMYVYSDQEPPRNVIVLIDELNRYCPHQTRISSVAQQIIEIARTGRSRGVILFGAQQFKSAVHNQVNENCATHVIGRTGSQELSSSSYRFLDELTKMSVSRLGKGELILAHPVFRQPVRVVFPRPAYRRMESQ